VNHFVPRRKTKKAGINNKKGGKKKEIRGRKGLRMETVNSSKGKKVGGIFRNRGGNSGKKGGRKESGRVKDSKKKVKVRNRYGITTIGSQSPCKRVENPRAGLQKSRIDKERKREELLIKNS